MVVVNITLLFVIFIEQHDDCHCYARHEGLHQEPVPGGGGGDHAAHRHRVRRGEHGRQLRGGEAEHEQGHQTAAAVFLQMCVDMDCRYLEIHPEFRFLVVRCD